MKWNMDENIWQTWHGAICEFLLREGKIVEKRHHPENLPIYVRESLSFIVIKTTIILIDIIRLYLHDKRVYILICACKCCINTQNNCTSWTQCCAKQCWGCDGRFSSAEILLMGDFNSCLGTVKLNVAR